MTSCQFTKNKEAGFTLVELAIVMIIIGLLIGGILKGQELVANAQTTATVAQIKGLNGAVATFRDKYSQYPGDMRNPEQRLRNCDAAPCNSVTGNDTGDGRINTPSLGVAPTNSQEGAVAMVHLAAADLISGVVIDDDVVAFGVMLPEAKVGGGFWLGHTRDGSAEGVTAGTDGMRAGHYLVFSGDPGENADAPSDLTASQAGQIDRKLDDGDASTGSVRGVGDDCADAGVYDESDDSSSCGMYIRVQG